KREDLVGLVRGLTPMQSDRARAWYARPAVLAVIVLAMTTALNVLFWYDDGPLLLLLGAWSVLWSLASVVPRFFVRYSSSAPHSFDPGQRTTNDTVTTKDKGQTKNEGQRPKDRRSSMRLIPALVLVSVLVP